MPDLIGSVGTYDGNLDDSFLVTPSAIADNAREGDTWVPPFLDAVVGTGCPGYLATARQIFDTAQEVQQFLVDDPDFVPPCKWLGYFGPLILRGSFTIGNFDPIEQIANWRLSAKTYRITGTTVLPTGEIICYYGVWDRKEWLYKGVKPKVAPADSEPLWCGQPQIVNIIDKYEETISAPQGDNRFLAGSVSITFLSDATDYDDPFLQYNPEGPFMPIPPIPDGYPAPPNTPPLQGQAVVDALSDDDCREIVERGDGFQTLWDVGDRGLVADEGEIQWYQTNTDTYGIKNVWLLPNIMEDTPVEILEPATKIVLGKVLDRVVDVGSVIVKRGGLNKVLTILGPAGKIIQTVEIGIELFEELQMLLQQLYVPQCIESDPPNAVGLLRMMPIPFPVQTLDGQSTLGGMQAICDALYSLLRCCPPCATDIWHEGPTWDAATDWLTDFLPSAVLFQTIEAKSPSHIAMGGQQKLGYFKWILQDDENLSTSEFQEPIWVNTNNSFFFVNNGLVKGLRWVPQNGVTVKVLYKYAPKELGLNRLTAPQTP
jgi:hypothetical protein